MLIKKLRNTTSIKERKTKWNGGHLQARNRDLSETNLNLEFPNHQNHKKINFCCLSHLVCGILLWQTSRSVLTSYTFTTHGILTTSYKPIKIDIFASTIKYTILPYHCLQHLRVSLLQYSFYSCNTGLFSQKSQRKKFTYRSKLKPISRQIIS